MFDVFDIPFLSGLPPVVRDWTIRTILALIVFGLVLLLRRVLTWVLFAPFRAFTHRTENDIDDAALAIVEASAGYLVVAFAILMSIQVLSVENVELIFMQRLARSLIIVGLMVAIYKAVSLIQADSQFINLTGISLDEALLPFVRTGLRVVLVAMAMVIIIQEWGYDVSGLIAGLGLGGLAFSLAAQDTVSNLFGFSTIVGDRPFVVGEYISTPNGEGTIERVGVRSTKIRTLDQSLIVVPNSAMANSAITNWSRIDYRRYNTVVGLTYATTPQQMREFVEMMRNALMDRPLVISESVLVTFLEFSASSLDVRIWCNVKTPFFNDWMAEREQINLLVMETVEKAGLSMAFPSRSIYIEQNAPNPHKA